MPKDKSTPQARKRRADQSKDRLAKKAAIGSEIVKLVFDHYLRSIQDANTIPADCIEMVKQVYRAFPQDSKKLIKAKKYHNIDGIEGLERPAQESKGNTKLERNKNSAAIRRASKTNAIEKLYILASKRECSELADKLLNYKPQQLKKLKLHHSPLPQQEAELPEPTQEEMQTSDSSSSQNEVAEMKVQVPAPNSSSAFVMNALEENQQPVEMKQEIVAPQPPFEPEPVFNLLLEPIPVLDTMPMTVQEPMHRSAFRLFRPDLTFQQFVNDNHGDDLFAKLNPMYQ
jgi:hypothetical protein